MGRGVRVLIIQSIDSLHDWPAHIHKGSPLPGLTVVLVDKRAGPKPASFKSYGVARLGPVGDLGTTRPMTPDTILPIGSSLAKVNKQGKASTCPKESHRRHPRTHPLFTTGPPTHNKTTELHGPGPRTAPRGGQAPAGRPHHRLRAGPPHRPGASVDRLVGASGPLLSLYTPHLKSYGFYTIHVYKCRPPA